MADTQHTTSTSKENTRTSGFTFPFEKCEEMFANMQNCCDSGEGSFDCCANMQQMCGGEEQETEEQ